MRQDCLCTCSRPCAFERKTHYPASSPKHSTRPPKPQQRGNRPTGDGVRRNKLHELAQARWLLWTPGFVEVSFVQLSQPIVQNTKTRQTNYTLETSTHPSMKRNFCHARLKRTTIGRFAPSPLRQDNPAACRHAPSGRCGYVGDLRRSLRPRASPRTPCHEKLRGGLLRVQQCCCRCRACLPTVGRQGERVRIWFRAGNYLCFDRDWLIDWLVGWLTDWLVD